LVRAGPAKPPKAGRSEGIAAANDHGFPEALNGRSGAGFYSGARDAPGLLPSVHPQRIGGPYGPTGIAPGRAQFDRQLGPERRCGGCAQNQELIPAALMNRRVNNQGRWYQSSVPQPIKQYKHARTENNDCDNG
jgi:hypothetical protein